MMSNTTAIKKLEDFPKVIVEYLNSRPRWTEAEINANFAEAKRIVEARDQASQARTNALFAEAIRVVEARAVADAGDENQGPSICICDEDSAVKQVVNSISGGACFGYLTAASIGASGTDSHALVALGVALALAITAWTWKK